MSTSLPFEQWLAHIRTHSTYYQKALRHLPSQGCTLEDLPIVDAKNYWVGGHDLDKWEVLTTPVKDALVFKTVVPPAKGNCRSTRTLNGN